MDVLLNGTGGANPDDILHAVAGEQLVGVDADGGHAHAGGHDGDLHAFVGAGVALDAPDIVHQHGVFQKVLRNELKDAIDLANKAEYDHASQIFAQKFGQLFRENPLDAETIEKVADAMLYPHFFFTIPGIQWMAWGSEAEKKGLSQIAVNLFEKGVSVEKDPKIRRRGLFYAGDLRLRMHLDEEKAKSELEEVLQLDSTDILANEVHKLLGK